MLKSFYILSIILLAAAYSDGQTGMPYISPITNMNIGMDTKLTYNLGNLAGRPFEVHQFDRVKGSPFYIDSFTHCYFTIGDGKTYKGIKMRLNLFSNELHFLGKDNAEFVADKGVIRKIVFLRLISDSVESTVFGCGYPPINNNTGNTYYEELTAGKITLLKATTKVLQGRQSLTSSPLDKEFVDTHSYYIYMDGKINRLYKGKEYVLNLLADKKDEMAAFLTKEKLKCNSTEDIRKAFMFYNQLLSPF
jgi:hypothetical protein